MIVLLATPENFIRDAVIVLASVAALIAVALVILFTLGYLLGKKHATAIPQIDLSPAPSLRDAADTLHDPKLVAVLTAAAVAALGQPLRVTDIQPAHNAPVGPLTLSDKATP